MSSTPALRLSAPARHHRETIRGRLVPEASPGRGAAERFIADVFARTYGARVPAFAPDLMVMERHGRLAAAAGWRGAADAPLYLERYLDEPVEVALGRLCGRPIARACVAEACNLAATHSGYGVHMIRTLAEHLDQQGYEWVVFTATSELVGIFGRLGLPPLGLAPARPCRMGADAAAWGRYYDTAPVVVAGRIRLALEGSVRA